MTTRFLQKAVALCALSALTFTLTPAAFADEAIPEGPNQPVEAAEEASPANPNADSAANIDENIPVDVENEALQDADTLPAEADDEDGSRIRVDGLELLEEYMVRTPSYFQKVIQLGQWDGQGLNDLGLINEEGELLLYAHDEADSYKSPRQIGTGWNIFTTVLGGGDFNGDSKADLLGIKANGDLFLYAGNGRSGFISAKRIGTGWNIFSNVVFVPHGVNDKPTILASGASGTFIYPTNGNGHWLTPLRQENLVDLKSTVAGPDFTRSGYSSLIVSTDALTITVHTTEDGRNYQVAGTITVPNGVESLLNASIDRTGKNVYIDFLRADAQARGMRLGLVAAEEPQPPLPPAPMEFWKDITFSHRTLAGTGWPTTNVYSLGDFNGDGHNDAAIIWPDGRLDMYSYRNGVTFTGKRQIGTGWTIFNDIHTGVDFNGDAKPDIVARENSGVLWLYPGNGRGSFLARQQIGTGWNIFEKIYVLQRGAGGAPVIYGLSGDNLRAYPTNGRGAFLAPSLNMPGYSWMKQAYASGDWNNDSRSDLLYKAANGDLLVTSQNPDYGFELPESKKIGTGWVEFTALAPALFNQQSKAIWAVSPEGRLLTYVFRNVSH